MNKILAGTLSLVAAASLNAAVLATVDGKNITDTDLNAIVQSMGGGLNYNTLPEDAKKKILDQTIERELLVKQAVKSGIEKSSDYKKALDQLKQNLALDMWMKKQFDEVKVRDADAKKFYDENGDKFMQKARVKARHILLKDEKAANEVISQLSGLNGEALEKKFVQLAQEKSTGPSAKTGGELGWFTQEQMVPSFSKAAFELKKGEYTKTPVKSQFGYHVILSEGNEPANKAKFDEVKAQVKEGLKMQQFRENIAQQAKKLRTNAKITIK